MHRLLPVVVLVLLVALSGCGNIKIPFFGSDDEAEAAADPESSAVAKEDMVIQKFGPNQGGGSSAAMTDDMLSGPATDRMAAAPVTQFQALPPETETRPAVVPPPAAVVPPPAAVAPAPAPAPVAPAPRQTAPSETSSRFTTNNKTAGNDSQAPAAAAPPAKPGCDAFAKICAQIVDDFEFRYRAALVQEGVYGVVGFVAPRKKELQGKKLDMTVQFAIVKGEGKASMPIPVSGAMTEPLRFERLFNVDTKPDYVYVESYTGKVDE
jgi:hypothetical protein